MKPSIPIPSSAMFDDPVYKSQFYDLASEMVAFGTKPNIIRRFTGLTRYGLDALFKKHGMGRVSPGRVTHRSARYYALSRYLESRYIGGGGQFKWNIQAAIFTNIYLKIEKAVAEPVNRGWLLAAAYRAYLFATDQLLLDNDRLRRMDINDAYDLTTHIGYGQNRKLAALALAHCGICRINYLVVTDIERDSQSCPCCAWNQQIQKKRYIAQQNASARRRVANALPISGAADL